MKNRANRAQIGQSQFLTAPVLAKPLAFNNLSLDDDEEPGFDTALSIPSNRDTSPDGRIMEMMAARASQQTSALDEDEDSIISSEKLSEEEKKEKLQRILHLAASNGDSERVEKIVKGRAREFVDLDAGDEEGTSPLIYASCFVSSRLFPGSKRCQFRTELTGYYRATTK